MDRSKRLTVGIVLAFFGLASTAFAQNAPSQHLRGTIDSFDGQSLTIKPVGGEDILVKLPPDFSVTGVTKATLTDVTKGKYVGISTSPPSAPGPLRALEIHTFPSEGRQFFSGWDLVPNGGMANGDVSALVDNIEGNQITLMIQGAERQIIVPRGIPIVAFGPGDKSMLTQGAHVVLSATKQPDGSYAGRGVIVGINGAVPPL